MSTFYDTVIRNSTALHSDAVCKDMAMLEPGTRAAILALVDEAKQDGHDLRVLETYRSQTRQSALFAKGATQLRTVGCHGYGVAVDFGVFTNGKYEEGNKPYVFLRDMARKHGLISGQDWGKAITGSFVDSGHIQRVPVWRQSAMFGGSWYPGPVYNPYTDSAAHGHGEVVGGLHGLASVKPAPAASPAPPTAIPAPAPRTGIVNTASLNVRKAAGTDSPVVRRLLRGASVTITGATTVAGSEWYAVEWQDLQKAVGNGFVAARYIDLT